MANNYPPGITDRMIPGNRPEDEDFEDAIEQVYDVLQQFNHYGFNFLLDVLDAVTDELKAEWNEEN
jgi:hypothetical protein